MNFNQKLKILFFLVRSKKSKDGRVPIYVRVTIDGLDDEMSTSCKILGENWDVEKKEVLPSDPEHKIINKRLRQIETDLERHFDLVQAKYGTATPVLVFESYKTPLNGQKQKDEKVQNLAFSDALSSLIDKYLKFSDNKKKAYEFDQIPTPERKILLEEEKLSIQKELTSLRTQGNTIFDKKNHQKTLILAVDEYLLDFLELAFVGERSPNSLEKLIGRKRRYVEFIQYRYKKQDLPLNIIEYSFIEDFYGYLKKQYRLQDISASKYAQSIKEIIERVVAKGWMTHNIFSIFKCTFKRKKKRRANMQEFDIIANHPLKDEELEITRDCYVFSCYTGYAYQEVYDAAPYHVKPGRDGEPWIYIDRQKTGFLEAVPLLPPAIKLIEKYKNHPESIRRNRLFPVPSNQAYNRNLKVIGDILNIEFLKEESSHGGRDFFTNILTLKNGVDLKTVSVMLGHQSVKTTETFYVDLDEEIISKEMQKVKEKLSEAERLKSEAAVVDINKPLKVVHIAAK